MLALSFQMKGTGIKIEGLVSWVVDELTEEVLRFAEEDDLSLNWEKNSSLICYFPFEEILIIILTNRG